MITIETIEGMEQAVIQHIRTAGIVNKSKETSLVDKVLDLRRERRRIFSSTFNELESAKKEVIELQLKIQQTEDDFSQTKADLERATLEYKSGLQNCSAVKHFKLILIIYMFDNFLSSIYIMHAGYQSRIQLDSPEAATERESNDQ